MKSGRSYVDYLNDIESHAGKAQGFLEGFASFEEFCQDERTLFAVVRALEVIGEASKHIPRAVRLQYSDIPWRGMTGMRDKVIHDYFGVDAEVVWRTVHEDLPPLREAIARILEDVKNSE